MKKSTRNWIIAIVVIALIFIAIYVYTSKTPENPLVGINNYDLTKLSPQDLATYNSLPDDSAKVDFLRILETQGKIEQINPVPNPTGSTPPIVAQPLTGIPIIDSIVSWWKKVRNKTYVQIAPIDDQGCDANGYNAIGVKCFGY